MTQLARAEEVRSNEDGMAASSTWPSMASVLGACGKARRGAKEKAKGVERVRSDCSGTSPSAQGHGTRVQRDGA
jgi:hypothetical protein